MSIVWCLSYPDWQNDVSFLEITGQFYENIVNQITVELKSIFLQILRNRLEDTHIMQNQIMNVEAASLEPKFVGLQLLYEFSSKSWRNRSIGPLISSLFLAELRYLFVKEALQQAVHASFRHNIDDLILHLFTFAWKSNNST